MKQEDKELLLKDLCARLPYNTMVSVAEGGIDGIEWNKVELNFFLLHQIEEEDAWEFVKPYLRPMSSMSEEEEYEYAFELNDGGWGVSEELVTNVIDWICAHHFDYRGLIPKGLAIEVTKDNNPYKD